VPLDLTAPGCYKRDVHYRRYLADTGKITVVCVQDFDYCDYDTARFIDEAVFESEAEAVATSIDVGPLFSIIESSTDRIAVAQAHCALRAILRQNGVVL
jgi:hypothetical protein